MGEGLAESWEWKYAVRTVWAVIEYQDILVT
jgi:hypothetical protein